LDAAALASVNAGECGLVDGFPPAPAGELTSAICDALDINNDSDVDATEGAGIRIDLDGDGDVDASEPQLADAQCDAILAVVPGDDSTDVDGTTEGTEGTTDVDGTTEEPEIAPGSLAINNFACPQVEVPVAVVSDPGAVGTLGDTPEEGCSATSADFEIFVNGDFTSDPIPATIDESGTINGIPPTQDGVPHALFDPASNVYFSIEIAPGEVTTATVLNPANVIPNADGDESGINAEGVAGDTANNADGASATDGTAEGDTSVADGTADNADGASASDGNDEGDTSNVARASDGDDAEGGISRLPSTGQGGDSGVNGSATALLFGAISMVALAGGFAWRQRRPC